MIGDWVLSAAGTIARVERDNVDKSGRNPKYFYYFHLTCERADGAPEGATLPVEIPLKAKDLDVARMIDPPPAVGDRVEVTARAKGPAPTTFSLVSIKRV